MGPPMRPNVGGRDRTARIVVGVVLVGLGAAGYAGLVRVAVGPFPQFLTSVVVALVGLVLLVTGLSRRCPVNAIIGRNTAGRR